jgi:uncharacterized protein YwgA
MCAIAGIPWKRYAIIADLADKLHNKFPLFGKTILQKFVYLLQEGVGVDCDYSYEFYTYGPYSSQLSQDLDFVESAEGIKIHFENWGFGGYAIEPGPQNSALRERAMEFLDSKEYKKGVERLIADFENHWAKALELRSTILFVERDFKNVGQSSNIDRILSTVSELKPKFTEAEIRRAIMEMENKGYISM